MDLMTPPPGESGQEFLPAGKTTRDGTAAAFECYMDTNDADAYKAFRHAHAAYHYASLGVANNDKTDFYRAYLAGRRAAAYANDACR